MAELRAARVSKGLTAKAVALRLGFRSSSVHSWERGATSPSYFALTCWCDFLGVTLEAKPKAPMRAEPKSQEDAETEEDDERAAA